MTSIEYLHSNYTFYGQCRRLEKLVEANIAGVGSHASPCCLVGDRDGVGIFGCIHPEAGVSCHSVCECECFASFSAEEECQMRQDVKDVLVVGKVE